MADPKPKVTSQLCWVNHGSYPGSTMFMYNYKYDDMVKYLKKIKATDWLAAIQDEPLLKEPGKCFCMKRTVENSKTGEKRVFFVIGINRKFNFDDWDYCMLAHEVTHLSQFFLPDLLDRNNEIEAEAYFHTHVMQQCLDAMRYKLK